MSKSEKRDTAMRRTVDESKDDPLLQMARTMFGGDTPIEDQEARGQKSFVNSCDLPTKCHTASDILEKIGVRLGEPYPDDPVFCPAILPEGWKKVATDHSMHSDLVDDRGRRRAGIFYKAAFYDRSASISFIPRFMIEENYDDFKGEDYRNTHIQFMVTDRTGESPFKCDPEPNPPREEGWEKSEAIREKQTAQCADWLKKSFPNWQDLTAYWD